MNTNDGRMTSFLVFSGSNFPLRSRKYLMSLMREVGEKHDVDFVIGAGNILAGEHLEKDLRNRQKNHLLRLREEKKKEKSKVAINRDKEKAITEAGFVKEVADALNDFLPRFKNGAKYHLVAAEKIKIYDGPLGCKILDELNKLRDDVRIASKLDKPVGDMNHDPETKIPVQVVGFGEIRVLVPTKRPWFYDNVTGLTQRLINSFASRSRSPAPPLIIVGCTGTGAFLPKYRGVPAIAGPAMCMIEEQQSTENMVGCTVVTIVKNGNGFRIIWKAYDFRTAVFNERDFGLPDNLSKCEDRVMDILKPGGASLSTILFRLNERARKPWSEDKAQKCIEDLVKKGLLDYNKKANRYAIADSVLSKASISLDEFLKDSKSIKFVQKSCLHAGSLKTLYYTTLRDLPVLARDADAIISNGDEIQGVSHNYEFNGEMLPHMNGADKHQMLAAQMKVRSVMDIFRARWDDFSKAERDIAKLTDKCLVEFDRNEGNHDEHRFSGNSKHAISMALFDSELMKNLVKELIAFLEEKKRFGEIGSQKLMEIVNRKMVRVGEDRVAWIKNVPIGLQHPRQGKTNAKGARIQQTANFFYQTFKSSPDERLRNISLVGVANFHEAAAIFTSIFGRTIFGVMTGAQLYTTVFEGNINKVVEYGMAKVGVDLNPEGKILAAEVEYSCQSPSDIAKEDQKIVLADHLDSETVLKHALELSKMFNIPWR